MKNFGLGDFGFQINYLKVKTCQLQPVGTIIVTYSRGVKQTACSLDPAHATIQSGLWVAGPIPHASFSPMHCLQHKGWTLPWGQPDLFDTFDQNQWLSIRVWQVCKQDSQVKPRNGEQESIVPKAF